ncbi:MAG: DUF973 family protein [Thermoplasmata archaeon]
MAVGFGPAGSPGVTAPLPYPPGFAAHRGAPTGASRESDARALSHVTVAAILALVGAIAGLVGVFDTSVIAELTASTGTPGTSFALSLSALYLLVILAGVGVLFGILELVFYRLAFHALTPHDRRFSTPGTLVLLALVAIVIIVAAGAVILYQFYQGVLCAGAGNLVTSNCLSTGTLLDMVGIIGAAAILALIGWIGLLVGIWRLGSRYNDSMFKVAAVLLVFPVLNLVAVVLILVAARSARGKLESSPGTPTFG